MKLILERHRYAPELNRCHVLNRGRVAAILPAPGCTTIAEARRTLFRPVKPVRLVVVHSEREGEWSGFNRTRRAGYELSAGNMNRIAADVRKCHDVGGKLLDGRTMPPSRERVETRLYAVAF